MQRESCSIGQDTGKARRIVAAHDRLHAAVADARLKGRQIRLLSVPAITLFQRLHLSEDPGAPELSNESRTDAVPAGKVGDAAACTSQRRAR